MPIKTSLLLRNSTQWLPALILSAAIIFYFRYLYLHALNIPFGDDVYDVLEFLSGVVRAQTWLEAGSLFLEQHNEHRTSSSRLIYFAAYLTEGEIDFRTLTYLANFALVVILGLFYLRIRDIEYRWLILLPATLFLFHLRAYEITLWSMAAFAYFYVFLYGFLCIYCLHSVTKPKFFCGVIFAILANFTLASGPFIWFVGLLSLIHQRYILRRISGTYLFFWCVCAVCSLLVWRSGMDGSLTLQAVLDNILGGPIHNLHYFLLLIGSSASQTNLAVATITGILLMSVLILLTGKSIKGGDIRLELCCWYIAFSVAAIVLGRAYFTDLEYALVSRYSFPSILMLASIWVLLAASFRLKNLTILAVVTIISATYCVYSYRSYSALLQAHVDMRVKYYNKGNYPLWGKPTAELNKVVSEAVSLDIYKPPIKPYSVDRVTFDVKSR